MQPAANPLKDIDQVVLGVMPNDQKSELQVSWTRKRRWRGHPDYWHLDFRAWSMNLDGSRTPIPGFGLSLRLDQVPGFVALLNRAVNQLEPGRDGWPVLPEGVTGQGNETLRPPTSAAGANAESQGIHANGDRP